MNQNHKKISACPVSGRCGGCIYSGLPYPDQLEKKQEALQTLLGGFGTVQPILPMEDPLYYRNKVHHVFTRDRQGNILSGSYEAGSHRVVPVENCLLEDRTCQEIMHTLRKLFRSFRITIYSETSGYGLLRHVLLRRSFHTGEVLVVLVVTSPVFPSKNNFAKALREAHPEVTSIVLNVNDRETSMVLGQRNITIYGPGFIRDRLMGLTFRISPSSFYQVNPRQTEVLYRTTLDFAMLTGTEEVLDAYCGTGTIGLSAAGNAGHVTGVELNADAVRDAISNARGNQIENAEFIAGDAGEYMLRRAAEKKPLDVLFMDPPRSGASEAFLKAVTRLLPARIVYVSCDPETLARDLLYLTRKDYRAVRIQPVDMFPFTEEIECVTALERVTKPHEESRSRTMKDRIGTLKKNSQTGAHRDLKTPDPRNGGKKHG